MPTTKEIYDSVVQICKEMETRVPHYSLCNDKEECDFYLAQREAAKEIRILLTNKYPLL